MNIEIIKGAPIPGRDYDTVVLIDVFRASSTMVCLLANGIREVVLTSAFEEMATIDPPPGLHVEYFSDTEHPLRTRDNSPIEALHLDPTNVHRAVIVSRNGTKVPSWINSCNELIVCSFLNLHAVADHITRRSPEKVTIIAIGHIRIPEEAEEDNLCAYALRDLLSAIPINGVEIREALRKRIEETRRDHHAPQGQRIEMDRAICCGISLFDVVPVINKRGGGYVVEGSAGSLETHIASPTFTAAEARTISSELRLHHSLSIPPKSVAIDLPDAMADGKYPQSVIKLNDPVLLAGRSGCQGFGEYAYPFYESFGRAVHGPRELDLAYVFSALLLSCGGSIHKTSNICRAFLEGYNEPYDGELFFALVLHAIRARLYSDQGLKSYYRENRIWLNEVIDNLSRGPVLDAPALIRHLCEKTNNNGKLDGRVAARQEIIYQKREGNEFSINLTNRCPNACVFCIRDLSPGWNRQKSSETPLNLYLATEPTIDEVLQAVRAELDERDSHLDQVMKFCGYGEPLLRPDAICEVSNRIKKEYSNVRVQVNTTGWPYYKHCLDAGYSLTTFRDSGVDIFSVSLNAPEKKLYNLLTRPGVYEVENTAFERTLEFIRESTRYGFETKATVVALPKLTQVHISECDARVKELGATLIVRQFVGKEESLSQDSFGTEVEAKIFNVDREHVRNVLRAKELGSWVSVLRRLLFMIFPRK